MSANDFDRPSEYVENVQCGRFDGGNMLALRFRVQGKPTAGFHLDRDLAELLRDEVVAILSEITGEPDSGAPL